ncbi:MAG: Gldg family protein [Clostridia bacterium]|nr:Gldg family protein [Clostridia bacterium]MBR2908588.1 Gldg family protein [Clostridia bacterium]
MKKQYNGKKIRYGSSSAILTAVIVTAVILLNVCASALSGIASWMYLDMTVEDMYTVSDECLDLLKEEAITMVDNIRAYNKKYNENGGRPSDSGSTPSLDDETEFVARDESISINIYFMDDKDVLLENSRMHYVLNTAFEIEKEFPDYVKISYINIDKNPSAVQKFLTTSLSTINKTDVVVEFGTEFRLIAGSRFFLYDSTSTNITAYNGEKQFASAILAVTRTESPICLVDMAHGEAFYDYSLLYTLEDAGFEIAITEDYLTDEKIKSVEEEFGGDVRLILIYNPNSDFLVSNKTSDVDEIDALDRFLDGKSSMMVFMSPQSPVLPNLEEYLEEWGISFDRHKEGNSLSSYMIKDPSSSLTSDGFSPVAKYVTTGLGGQITADMRGVTYPKKLIFRNAMSISYSNTYQETTFDPSDSEGSTDTTSTEPYVYGSYFSNGVTRSIYDLFVSSSDAVAMANGKTVAKADEYDPFRFMTVSCEMRITQEDNYGASTVQENSYVIACGSTDFATEAYLQSAVYGNTDFLLSALTVIGREPVPVGLIHKSFGDYSIDSLTTSAATVWTVVLTAIPTSAALITGVVILVKRKYA